MTHLETTYAYGGYIRVMYDFALHPLWRKIEVLADNSTAVYQWQENVWPEGSTNEVKTFFCRSYEKASTGIAGFNASSVISYTYGGIDAIGDTLARRFELVVSQPSRKDGKSEALRIDYWDSTDGNMPLKFEFQHPDIGTVVVEVLEFRALNASSPEAAPAMFKPPPQDDPDFCLRSNTVPALSSPFMARGAVVSDTFGSPAVIEPIVIDGSMELDTCEKVIKGCVTIGVGLPKENWLVKTLGVELSIDLAKVCVGYNYAHRVFFIEGVLIFNVIVAKVELAAELDFSACCIWIASVSLEASIGITFFDIWITLGVT
ncbi:hypothetical protein GPECTOR_27g636 [Gonium pectorale]|uniref:Uncharacterized protein n=1 Tax=Gonium pectorale TaxID=33097 RepID=A0A150GF68_GONPE|nr:hypothetical protein GPECTOR_27g636 [Gonium pectorale]|eukprot:KXZ48466.1 hypothetical protein GPECTOR_27g636 [Gonium pectorale]